MNPIIEKILTTFEHRGSEKYGTEAVTQLEHALQSASLAEAENASAQLITAALLHDIGHILDTDELPKDDSVNLDDLHEEIGYQWLLEHFGLGVAKPVQMHVMAKRYLCTIDDSYTKTLSPTSLKSFYDQGGKMSPTEKLAFEKDPFFEVAVALRKWDDTAKEANKKTQSIRHFLPYIEESFVGKA